MEEEREGAVEEKKEKEAKKEEGEEERGKSQDAQRPPGRCRLATWSRRNIHKNNNNNNKEPLKQGWANCLTRDKI